MTRWEIWQQNKLIEVKELADEPQNPTEVALKAKLALLGLTTEEIERLLKW